jgi:outer membrane protein OmpA-like peptidoglycan-associated protein
MINGRRIAEPPRRWTTERSTPAYPRTTFRDSLKRHARWLPSRRAARKKIMFDMWRNWSRTPRSPVNNEIRECVVVSRIGKLVALAGLIARSPRRRPAQVPEQQGFFGNIDGRWMWLGGDRISSSAGTAPVTDGPGGQMLIGYKLDPHWDVALAGDVQGLLSHLTKFQNGTLSVDTNHQHFDLEVGYSRNWWRLNGGLRGIHYRQGASYNVPGFAGYDQREMYGIGVKVGAGARLPIADRWAVIGGADAALLYTNYGDTGSGVLINNSSYWQLVPQLSAELGINWRSSDSPFSITTGARLATSFNTTITADSSRQGTLIEFGPFVRLAYNFAGPSRSSRLAVKEEREIWTNNPPTGSARYVVHFGHEKSDISLVAGTVIRQAAEDVRRGRPANIAIASTDVENGSDYSRALARRRAEAIRDALARDGVSPGQVAIVPDSGSAPLVAAAGGGPRRRIAGADHLLKFAFLSVGRADCRRGGDDPRLAAPCRPMPRPCP